MVWTVEDICESLERLDEVTLIETLQVSSADIVEAFKEHIEINYSDIHYKVTGQSVEEAYSGD